MQLDHLGDAVLSTPLIAELRAAYPEATIDVLASPSNHEVFEADPHVNRVKVAERTWFERRPDRWGLVTAVWNLGRSLRAVRYDLGIDVRGDVLTVLVLALAGVPRRVGWSMGGGAFLLTDVAAWIPGRHEVRSRLALLDAWESRPTSRRGSTSTSATRIGSRLPAGSRKHGRAEALAGSKSMRPRRRAYVRERHESVRSPVHDDQVDQRRAGLAARRSILLAAAAAGRAPRGRKRGQALAYRSWKVLIERFLESGWRVVVVGGVEDVPLSSVLEPHDRLRDWTGSMTVTQTTALLERADLFIGVGLRPGAPGGLGGNPLGHLVQRDQPAPAVAAVVAAFARAPPPRSLPALPPEGLPARRPSLHVGFEPRPRLPRRDALVVSHPPGGVAACADLMRRSRVVQEDPLGL